MSNQIKIRLAALSASAGAVLAPFVAGAQSMSASTTAAVTSGVGEITTLVLASLGALFVLYGGFLGIRWIWRTLKKAVK